MKIAQICPKFEQPRFKRQGLFLEIGFRGINPPVKYISYYMYRYVLCTNKVFTILWEH